MNDVTEQARQFLNQIFASAGFDLKAQAHESPAGCLLNIDGGDAALLRAGGGELLDAVEHLLNQAFSHEVSEHQRLVCDVQGYREERETELRAMARHAADRVLSSGVPFTFGPMNANERRVIHLALAEQDGVVTESVGEGAERRLVVSLRKSG